MSAFIALLLSRVKRSGSLRLVLSGAACLLIGAVLFCITQHIAFTTALYWAITTATTVGYGDVTPKNPAGRAVAVGVMLTTIPLFAGAFALMASAVVATHLRRLLGMARLEPKAGSVLIFGMSPVVPRVAAELAGSGRDVAVVADVERSALPESVQLMAGDPKTEETVRRSHPERAGQVLVTGPGDADVLVTAVLVRHIAPEVPTLALAGSVSVCQALGDLGIRTSFSSDELIVHTLAKSLEAPHAGELLLRIVDSDDYKLKERPVASTDVGRPLSAVRAERDGLVLGAVQADRVTVGVAEDIVLAAGDSLIVLEMG